MSDQWPPPSPDINGAFKKAHAPTNDNIPPASPLPIVTKKQIQQLENQRTKASPQLNLTPPGMKRSSTKEVERNARIEKMKTRLQQNKGKARDDFNRSKER